MELTIQTHTFSCKSRICIVGFLAQRDQICSLNTSSSRQACSRRDIKLQTSMFEKFQTEYFISNMPRDMQSNKPFSRNSPSPQRDVTKISVQKDVAAQTLTCAATDDPIVGLIVSSRRKTVQERVVRIHILQDASPQRTMIFSKRLLLKPC